MQENHPAMSAPSPHSAFNLQRIQAETWVHQIDFHWEIDSTNNRALQLAELAETATPTLVLAEQQTSGRGRGANRWWSTAGSLTFSLLIDSDDVPVVQTARLSLTVGLSICQAVERLAPAVDVGLKWPNDVYLAGRKLAGILIERPASQPPRVVIGVGINVNNSCQAAPADLTPQATSLCDCLDQVLDLNDVLIHCLQQMEMRLQNLRAARRELADQWQAYHILQGRRVELVDGNRQWTGICHGIDDHGALLLQTADGFQHCPGGVVTKFD